MHNTFFTTHVYVFLLLLEIKIKKYVNKKLEFKRSDLLQLKGGLSSKY